MKNKLHNIIYLLIASIIFVGISSCNKNNVTNYLPNDSKLPGILSYYNILSKKTNAAFGVSISAPISDVHNERAPLLFNGVFIADNGGILRGGKVTCGTNEFLPDSHNNYGNGVVLDRSIVGSKQQFTLQKPASFASAQSALPTNTSNFDYPTTTDSLYIPEILEIVDPSISYEADKNIVTIGKKYNWKPDLKNLDKGIIVGVEYTAGNLGNEILRREYPNDIKHGMVIEDNGTYSLPETLFTDIPRGARVTVTFGRANYTVAIDKDNVSYTLFAYSYKYFDYTYQ